MGLVSLCAAATGMALSLYGSQLLIKTTKSPQSTKTANKGGPLPAAIERPDSISPFSLTLSGESLLDEQYEWSGISITERVRRGEEFLRSHEPQRAAEEFGLVLDSPADEATHSGRTYLMYGIARELLGDLDGSLRSYREAFRRAQHPWQKACVTLRLAHGMSQQDDQWATAVGVLMSSMLRQGAATPLNVYNESIISLSLYMTGKQSDIPATTHLIDDATLLVPPCPVNPDDILQQWDQAWSLPSDAITQLQLDSVRKLGPQPNEWLIKVKSPTMAVEDLLSALAQKGEWALRITDAGRHILSGRSITLNTRELSTEVFLDALLLPLGAEWQFDGQVLQVSSIAETIVAPERDTPGIIARHCAKPMARYVISGKPVASCRRGFSSSRSTQSRIAPPTISEKQTTNGLNNTVLMNECASAPITAAGRNAIRTPMTNRRAAGSVNMPSAMRHNRRK